MTVSETAKTAVIYARLSEDKTRDEAGEKTEGAVERQIRLCTEYANSHGITVTKVYKDNSVSAVSGRRRPDFERMLKDKPPAIIVWHQDRLIRLTKELEKVIALDVPIYSVTGGVLDLSNPQGRAVARTVAAWSTYEGEHKGDRQGSAISDFFDAGEPVPGKRRFGYLPADEKVHRRVNTKAHPDEAPTVQWMFQSYLDGRSINGMAKELGWRPRRVRDTLSNPAYAGYVVRRGDVRPAAEHVDRLVSEEDFRAVEGRLAASVEANPRPGGVIKYVASGIARCGVCDGPLSYRNGYLCKADLSHPTIKREFLETKIRDAVVNSLLWGRSQSEGVVPRLRVIEARLSALQGTEDELAEALAGGMSWKAIKPQQDALTIERTELQEERAELLAASVQASILADLRSELWDHDTHRVSVEVAATMRAQIRERYDALAIEQKRELIRALPPIKVYPGRGPERVVIE